MSNKKRNKKYRGEDAASTKPSVVRFTAVKKSPLREWWDGHKMLYLGIAVPVIALSALTYALFALFTWIF